MNQEPQDNSGVNADRQDSGDNESGRPNGVPYNPEYQQQRQQQERGGDRPYDDSYIYQPFRLIADMLPRKAANAVRTMYAVIGVLAVAIGIAVLVWPVKTLAVVAVALGLYFLGSGVLRILSALVELGLPGGWRVLDIMVGILLSAGGVIVLKNVSFSGQALAIMVTMIIGIGWIVEGVLALAETWKLAGSGWAVLYAVISVLAGIVVLVSPISATIWLVIFIGAALVVMGVFSIVRAFMFGRSTSR